MLRLAERWRRRHSHDPLDEPSDLYESDGCDRDGDGTDTAVTYRSLTASGREGEDVLSRSLFRAP